MTFLTTIRFCTKHHVDIEQVYFKVSLNAQKTRGTTANLKAGDVVSIKNLLFCMMLPSGNDAAYSIAENIGALLYKMSKGVPFFTNEMTVMDITKE